MNIPIIALAVVFLFIAWRRIGRLHFALWQIMLFGAAAVLVTGQIGPPQALRDNSLARLARLSLALIVLLAVAKMIMVFAMPQITFSLTAIALIAAAPIMLFSPQRWRVLRHID